MVLRTISCVCGRPDELVAVHGVSEYVHVFVDIIGYWWKEAVEIAIYIRDRDRLRWKKRSDV
jgi:hypothetical protein